MFTLLRFGKDNIYINNNQINVKNFASYIVPLLDFRTKR